MSSRIFKPAGAFDEIFQGLSVHKFHRVKVVPAALAQVEDRGNVRVPNAGGCSRFAQKTKPRRFVSEIFFVDDFQGHGISQIDVKRLVSNAHRTATQFDRFSVLARYEFVLLKSLRRAWQCRLDRFLESRLAGLTPASESIAKHADRTEFHCSRKLVTTTRAGASFLRFHCVNAIHAFRRQTVVPFQKRLRISSTVANQSKFRNKILNDGVLRRLVLITTFGDVEINNPKTVCLVISTTSRVAASLDAISLDPNWRDSKDLFKIDTRIPAVNVSRTSPLWPSAAGRDPGLLGGHVSRKRADNISQRVLSKIAADEKKFGCRSPTLPSSTLLRTDGWQVFGLLRATASEGYTLGHSSRAGLTFYAIRVIIYALCVNPSSSMHSSQRYGSRSSRQRCSSQRNGGT